MIGLFTTSSFSQTKIESVLRKYRNDDNVMALMYEGEKLQNMIKQNKDLKSVVNFIDIVVFKKNADVSKGDKDKIKTLLLKDGYDLLINLKSPEGKALVQGIGDENTLKKVFVQAQNEEFSIYAIMAGDVHLDEIAAIASSVNMKELDALKMLK